MLKCQINKHFLRVWRQYFWFLIHLSFFVTPCLSCFVQVSHLGLINLSHVSLRILILFVNFLLLMSFVCCHIFMCSHVVKWGHWGVGGAAELVYTHPEFSFYGLHLFSHMFSIFLEPKQYEKHFRNWFVRFVMRNFYICKVGKPLTWNALSSLGGSVVVAGYRYTYCTVDMGMLFGV